MTSTRSLPYFGFLMAMFGTILAGHVHAQVQKYGYQCQKGPGRESLEQEPPREPFQQGGYQAPPPTGALQGPTRELGLSGGEIEIPALRLRLPRVRLPALSVFVTPPQMQIEEAKAPLVQQVQEQVSVPAGGTPPPEALRDHDEGPEAFRGRDDESEPYQKGDFTGFDPSQGVDPTEIARMKNKMDQFERRMDQKLASLTQSIEVLVAEKMSEETNPVRNSRSPDLVPLPVTEDTEASQVRPSAYLFSEPAPRIIHETPQLRRLPPMTR